MMEPRDIIEMGQRYPLGSKVRCIRGYNEERPSGTHLKSNQIYTVREVGKYGLFVMESSPEGWWGWEHWADERWDPINWASDELWNCRMILTITASASMACIIETKPFLTGFATRSLNL